MKGKCVLDKTVIKTHPKINISLDVLSKRPDGYHEVKMIMQSLAIYDQVSVELTDDSEISVGTNVSYLPNDKSNIAYKAAALFIEYFNIKNTGVKIFIEKNIPVAAGMAGGSTNAAGVLKALNTLTGINCDEKTLMEIGVKVGADVPYCIYGKTALAEGLGEILTPIKQFPETVVCLAKPDVSVSTAEIFKALNAKKIEAHPDTKGIISAIEDGDVYAVSKRMYNVLESVTAQKLPVINELKGIMLDYGAMGTIMTGSGPTVFGLFEDEIQAEKARQELAKAVSYTMVTKTI